MSKKNVGIIDGALYENGSEYLGWASVTLPTITAKTLTVTGAGIAGDVDIPIAGHKSAMGVTVTFTDAPEASRKILTNGLHIVELRVARENYDSTAGKIEVSGHKYIMALLPRSENLGNVAPATQQGASAEFSCLWLKEFINNKLMRHYDPINCIDIGPDGADSLKDVRNALGK